MSDKFITIESYEQSAAGIREERIHIERVRDNPDRTVTVETYSPAAMGFQSKRVKVRDLLGLPCLLLLCGLWWSAFAQVEESRVVMQKGSGAPTANCVAGERFFRTDATAGQNLYLCTATNTWTQVTGGGATVIRLPLAACNTGPTYVGGSWMFSTGVAPFCNQQFSAFTTLNIPRMRWNSQNDETVAAFTWPSGAGTSVTFRAKFSFSATTTPTMEASIGCHADGSDTTAAPASPAEITPVSLTFNTVWTTANRLNEGTATLTNASFTAGKACWIKIKRTDANAGDLDMHNTAQLEF